MTKYRNDLPQLADELFLTDGGIETTLIFHEGLELPDFAAFYLLRDDAGTAALRNYFRTYAALAQRYGTGFILESPTWRANPDWGTKLGYSAEELAAVNRQSIELVSEIRREFENEKTRMVVSGCTGPRGDGSALIPDGASQIRDGDHLFIIGEPRPIADLAGRFGA